MPVELESSSPLITVTPPVSRPITPDLPDGFRLSLGSFFDRFPWEPRREILEAAFGNRTRYKEGIEVICSINTFSVHPSHPYWCHESDLTPLTALRFLDQIPRKRLASITRLAIAWDVPECTSQAIIWLEPHVDVCRFGLLQSRLPAALRTLHIHLDGWSTLMRHVVMGHFGYRCQGLSQQWRLHLRDGYGKGKVNRARQAAVYAAVDAFVERMGALGLRDLHVYVPNELWQMILVPLHVRAGGKIEDRKQDARPSAPIWLKGRF
ncbi:hypothetical protein B0T22DRAFT_486919 [Podospora appendiculata]|uniref:Uncharacterized protein n=1 Tax=Podospora appendiculata TaxID=314037 RepID=A0AAE1CG66_9PEZI|nr:hypothetical protein B0T22DRAFT_486919 [Podospora appendiculata]